jgi:hypothetical protein
LGDPLRSAPQALEIAAPIFWSYMAMTALAFSFAIPEAKWLGLNDTMPGQIATPVLFQGIAAAALRVKSRHVVREAGTASRSPFVAE